MKTFEELNKKYDLNLEKIIKELKENNLRNVLLQFPDGLKPHATMITDYLNEKTGNKINFFIWVGSCFGACDNPILPKKIEEKIDLIIQFGHNELIPQY